MRPVRTRGSARRGPRDAHEHNCQVSNRGVAAAWRPQVHGTVWAMLVVVRDVLFQDRPQVPRPGDQHPVSDLGLGRRAPRWTAWSRNRVARSFQVHQQVPGLPHGPRAVRLRCHDSAWLFIRQALTRDQRPSQNCHESVSPRNDPAVAASRPACQASKVTSYDWRISFLHHR